jgi:NAD(P)-dependent dehydrogenase (short-subunit alcohol dehydrogenase family)
MHDFHTTPADFTPVESTLDGKVVLVTGAASEIGSAVVLAAARSGATVIMLDRKQRFMTAMYDQICDLGLEEPMMIEFDLARADSNAFEILGNSLSVPFPEIHGLVHCAMWGAPLTPLSHAELETWSRVLDQQLIKPMYLTKTLQPNFNHPGLSSIIFTVMDIGRTGRAYWGPVGAAFAGLENLCETMNAELVDYQTRVYTIDPGKVKTAIRKQFYPGESGEELRSANDNEILNTYLYLLSDQSKNDNAGQFSVAPLRQ